MNHRKPFQRLLAMALSIVMVLGMTPLTAVAVEAAPRGEIIAWEMLPDTAGERAVPPGTSLEDLNLPDTLSATVRLGTDEQNSATVGEFVYAPAPAAVDIPVSWTSAPDYDRDRPGTYQFTPELAEGYTLAAGGVLPEITVTVAVETPSAGLVTAFADLADDIRWQNTLEPVFPAAVPGTVEGFGVDIPVTWTADHEYDQAAPAQGLYVFTALLKGDYTVAGDIELPRITVYIPAASGGRLGMMRMAGEGTDGAPLEITTAAQLREIAVLVNSRANGLELFLFNDADARVSLKLKNDIDLSAYGKDYDGGQGWKPIGYFNTSEGKEYAFKGSLDGGGHVITGLYIDRPGEHDIGLFGYVTGIIKNLGVINGNVKGQDCVGGVIGFSIGAQIEKSFYRGNVTGASSVGGLAGMAYTAAIEHCYTAGAVTGNGRTGGLVGQAYAGSAIKDSYSASAVTGSADYDSVGGLAGLINNSTIENCYAAGAVSHAEICVGGIAGRTLGTSTVKNCAALNMSVEGTGYYYRVSGTLEGTATLHNNIAFSGMTVNGSAVTGVADDQNGASKTGGEIKDDTGNILSALFTAAKGWSYTPGGLPVLRDAKGGVMPGQDAALPGHINDSGSPFAGAGSSDDPYQIATPAQLARLAELVNAGTDDTYVAASVYYQLTADIDLSGYGKDYDDGKGWKPIGYFDTGEGQAYAFKGRLDGGGHVITGLYIDRPDSRHQGLFGYMQGVVQNLGVVNANITGQEFVGGIAGGAYKGSTIQNCYSTGNISSENSYAGGIAGSVFGMVKNYYAAGSVTAGGRVGGIAGYVDGTVENCYALNTVRNTKNESGNAGGLAGWVGSGGTLKNSAALNFAVEDTGNVGRVAGFKDRDSNLAGNIAFSGMTVTVGGTAKTISSDATGIDGADKTAAEIAATNFFQATFANDTAWQYETGKLPILKKAGSTEVMPGQDSALPLHLLDSSNPFAGGDGTSAETAYQIATPAQLARLAELVNAGTSPYAESGKYYTLTADIDLSEYGKDYDGGKGWKPIGTSLKRFEGIFNGNSKTITGLYINRPGEGYVGLFGGYTWGSELKNLRVVDVDITGERFVGGIAGIINGNSRIENCSVSGKITGAGSSVGGIAGNMEGSSTTIANCYSAAAVSGAKQAGGITGRINMGTVENSYFAGTVSGTSDGVGGIAGYASGTVKNCYSTGTVTGPTAVGGIAGWHSYGTVENCYSLANVNGTDKVGGIVGHVEDYTVGSTYYGKVQNCAALNPSVAAAGTAGEAGRVAGLKDEGSTLTNNYAFSGLVGGGTAKTLSGLDGADMTIEQMLSNAFWTEDSNWNTTGGRAWNDSVWTFTEGQLPILSGLNGQSGAGGLYLTGRNIAYAHITLSPNSFTYNGTEQKPGAPSITVEFDNTCLVEGRDYTYAITSGNDTETGASAGTKAGIVTLTFTGKGNYKGTKEVTYTITPYSGGGTTTTPTAPSAVTPPTVSGNTATITVTPTVSGDGQAAVTVTAAQMDEVIAQAKAAAANSGDKPAVEIKVGDSGVANTLAATIPHSSIQTMADENIESLTVTSSLATLTFDSQALNTINDTVTGDITVTIAKVDIDALPEAVRQIAGNRPVYDFTVTGGDKTISDFNGTVTVAIPYTPAADEDINAIIVYYINDRGELDTVTNGRYDPERGMVVFTADHFSRYAVGYNKVNFKDVAANAWYAEAVTYIAAREITSGTSKDTFNPDLSLTRGQFITLVMRAYQIVPEQNITANFTDAGNTYYTGYLAAAKRLGITQGTGDNKFAPEADISRQDMFTLLYNVLKNTGNLPVNATGKSIDSFSDSQVIAAYAKDAVSYLIKTGTISGSNGKLNPVATTSRAEMTQVLYNLLSGQ